MIINNKHDAYIKNVPEIIHDVIVEGSHTLTQDEALYFNEDEFYGEYDSLMGKMNFPAVPLAVATTQDGQKIVTLHPAFMQRLDMTYGHNDFEAYQYLFNKRFDMLEREKQENEGKQEGFGTEQLGEIQERKDDDVPNKIKPKASESFEEEGSVELESSRQKNADYAAASVLFLFKDGNGEDLDGYGWIENRATLFFETMDTLCDMYALPRLPILLDEEDVPYFAAPEEQVDKVIEFYHARKEVLANLTENLRDENEIIENTAMALGLGALRSTWMNTDNKQYDFNDQVLRYSDRFMRNGHDLAAINGGHVMTKKESAKVDLRATKKLDFPMLNYN